MKRLLVEMFELTSKNPLRKVRWRLNATVAERLVRKLKIKAETSPIYLIERFSRAKPYLSSPRKMAGEQQRINGTTELIAEFKK